jgi:hypothetical protein
MALWRCKTKKFIANQCAIYAMDALQGTTTLNFWLVLYEIRYRERINRIQRSEKISAINPNRAVRKKSLYSRLQEFCPLYFMRDLVKRKNLDG